MPGDREYYNWLVHNFCIPIDDKTFEHHTLLHQMYRKEYYYTIRNDENRAEDGLYLRYLYSLENPEAVLPDRPCTFLEFMIGIGKRLSENLAEGDELPVFLYFWELVTNIDLSQFTDMMYGYDSTTFDVDEIMNFVMDRRYDFDGSGGVFPLLNAERDQRKVEIWYQMQAYLFENPGFFRER